MIVVTGATGNIGRVLVTRLLAEGAAVRALTLPRA
ncbi:NmrA family NAD(P)-binding protein [Streptomyces sp. bgisy084]